MNRLVRAIVVIGIITLWVCVGGVVGVLAVEALLIIAVVFLGLSPIEMGLSPIHLQALLTGLWLVTIAPPLTMIIHLAYGRQRS